MGTLRRTDILYAINDQGCSCERYLVPLNNLSRRLNWICGSVPIPMEISKWLKLTMVVFTIRALIMRYAIFASLFIKLLRYVFFSWCFTTRFYRIMPFSLHSTMELTRNIHAGIITHFWKKFEIRLFGLAGQYSHCTHSPPCATNAVPTMKLVPLDLHPGSSWLVHLKHRHNISMFQCDITQESQCGKIASGALSFFLMHPKVTGRKCGNRGLCMHPAQPPTADSQLGYARVLCKGASLLPRHLVFWLGISYWMTQPRCPQPTSGPGRGVLINGPRKENRVPVSEISGTLHQASHAWGNFGVERY